eukprot:TRINITY_DN18078_c0_g1_i1.p1 TRINITY_DN18078_c0_g1~~TRINITY_DN18078_c0_g1_i1.p1  ORF type:complete len:346 (+),score=83.76 TRINITY_DN18078_c0_g1_i1:54-1040(+)
MAQRALSRCLAITARSSAPGGCQCRQLAGLSMPAVLRRSAATASGGGPSSTTNSYISLGKFESMGTDVGRMATGIAYLEDALQFERDAYAAATDPKQKVAKGFGLAKSLMEIGRQHHQLTDPKEAIVFYKEAFDLYQGTLSFQTEGEMLNKKALTYAKFSLSEVCSSLGVAYNDAGQPEEALQMHQKALDMRKEIVGKDHPSVAECLNNLGGLYYGRGNLQKAAESYEQALELLMLANEGKPENPYVALTLYNLGLCRGGLGQLQAAEAALKQALTIAERSLGSDHRQVDLIRQTLKTGPAISPQQHEEQQRQRQQENQATPSSTPGE